MPENVPSGIFAQRIRRLIRIYTRCIFDSQGCKVFSCGQRILRSDCADKQGALSFGWAHMSEGTFSHVTAHMVIYVNAELLDQM